MGPKPTYPTTQLSKLNPTHPSNVFRSDEYNNDPLEDIEFYDYPDEPSKDDPYDDC